MTPVGNAMKSRKSKKKIHETEERPKTVSSVTVSHVAPDDQMKDHVSSSLVHESDIHPTGTIKEGESCEDHIIIIVDDSGSVIFIENADVLLNIVEREAEEGVASAGGSENVCVTNIPLISELCREEIVPYNACVEQNPLGNQHHTVTSSRSEPHINFLQHVEDNVTDSVSTSPNRISSDMCEEATGSSKNEDREIEVVSLMLVLSHL